MSAGDPDYVEIRKETGFKRWVVRLKNWQGRNIGGGLGGQRGSYASKWGAKRAARRAFPGAEIRVVWFEENEEGFRA